MSRATTICGSGSGGVDTNEGNVCRICLSLSKEIFSLFEPHLNFTPCNVINLLVDIKISVEDNLPRTMCKTCLTELELIVNFKRKCEQSDSSLRSSVLAETIKTESIKLEIDDYENDVPFESCCDYEYYSSVNELNSAVTNTHNTTVHKPVPPKVFQCDNCQQIFNTKFKLKMHWKRSHEPKSYTCKRCKRMFKSSSSFRNHNLQKESCTKKFENIIIEGVGKSRIFCCTFCDYKSNFLERLKVHVVIHTGDKPFQCKICQKSYSQRSGLTLHKQNEHPDSKTDAITCYVCAKTIKGRYKFATHLRRVHGKGQYQCDICKLFVKSKSSIICHLKKHANLRQYVCDVCGESFNVASDLNNHKKRRHDGFLHSCSQCGYRARKKSSMQRHGLLHSNETLSQCEQCYRFYECPLKLYKHIRGCHQRVTQELHHCRFCNKGFIRKDHCAVHERNVHHLDDKNINVSSVKLKLSKSKK